MSDLWDEADIIYKYTRADAIRDGVLTEVTGWARRAGFQINTCLTSAVSAFVDVQPDEPGTYEARVMDLLKHCHQLALQNQRKHEIEFEYELPGLRAATMILHVDPGDHGEPVLTIGYPEDF